MIFTKMPGVRWHAECMMHEPGRQSAVIMGDRAAYAHPRHNGKADVKP